MDEFFMREALKEARKAYDDGEIPVGAVVVYKGEIIGRGHNRVEMLKNPLSHAEMIAIDQASKSMGAWRLIDCELYVTLEPCAMCAGAMVNSRIDKLIVGSLDPKRGCAGSLMNLLDYEGLNHKVEIKLGVLEDECRDLMQSFFRELREYKKNKR